MPLIIWHAGSLATTRTRRTSSRKPTCGPSSSSGGSGAGTAVPGCCASFATPFTIGSSAIAGRKPVRPFRPGAAVFADGDVEPVALFRRAEWVGEARTLRGAPGEQSGIAALAMALGVYLGLAASPGAIGGGGRGASDCHALGNAHLD